MEFNKNKLINKTIDKYAETWSHLLNTGDFIKEKYLNKIDGYIYKNMTQKFKEIEIFDLLHKEEIGYSIGIFAKLRIWFSGLRPVYERERNKQGKAVKRKRKNFILAFFHYLKYIHLKRRNRLLTYSAPKTTDSDSV